MPVSTEIKYESGFFLTDVYARRGLISIVKVSGPSIFRLQLDSLLREWR